MNPNIDELNQLTEDIKNGKLRPISPELKQNLEEALLANEETKKMPVKVWAKNLTNSVFPKPQPNQNSPDKPSPDKIEKVYLPFQWGQLIQWFIVGGSVGAFLGTAFFGSKMEAWGGLIVGLALSGFLFVKFYLNNSNS